MGDWFKKWKMPVNVNKSGVVKFGSAGDKVVPYALYNEPLKVLQSERDLGVIMDSSLSYKLHIQKTVNRAMMLYGWMARNLATRDSTVVLRVYKSLIRPLLEYASSVWAPTRVGLMNSLEKVQRKVTKLAIINASYTRRLEVLNLPTLRWRRIYLDLLQVHRILHGDQSIRKQMFAFSSEVSSANIRRHQLNVYKPSVHTGIYQNHFVNRTIDLWNSLPEALLDLSRFDLFKRHLKAYMMTSGEVKPYACD
jgi:hypothetical protein